MLDVALALHVSGLIQSSQEPYDVGAGMVLILQLRKLSHGESKKFSPATQLAGVGSGIPAQEGGSQPRALTTSRLCGLTHPLFSQSFSPDAGTGWEAWVPAGTEPARLSDAKLCSGRTSLCP